MTTPETPPPARPQDAPLESVRNIGPAMAAALRNAGVPDAAALHVLGADAAYARLLTAGHGQILSPTMRL
jgi:hypothetical protein